MDPRKWAIIESLYDAALAKEPSVRSSYLAQACREHPELQAEVESLLRCAGEELNSPLEDCSAAPSLLEDVAFVPAPAAFEAGAAAIDGRYKLLRLIGDGGMGEVWLAEQKKPVRRRVAIKLIKAGMDTREVMARFESERQALALMDHPAIAKVFDAGSTPAGRPYFVMEYVPGIPITNYCDKHNLTVRERLQLLIQVCEGVKHAHQKSVIHRDLKPSNILVTELDDRPAPKIIDFGVAKAMSRPLTENTFATRLGAFIGTPVYMSPEQADPASQDVDTRADVYSLGVILYELLAGVPPLDLRKITFEEFLRRLREEEPSKPSTKIRTRDAATSTEVARKRRTEPAPLARQVRGDLDSIALKALEKDRSRRYGSPSDLAADISRYLNNQPVSAVPPSVAYRARKFARRHRLALVTAAAFVLMLIAAAAVSIRQSIRANSEAAVAQAVNDFLQNDLLAQASAVTQSGPSTKPEPHLEVRTALDRAAARLGGKFEREPEVEAAIRDTIGQTYMDLGLYPEARKQLDRALELHRRAEGTENPKTLKTMSRLGVIARVQGKYPEAEELLTKTLRIQRRVLGSNRPDTLYTMNSLGGVYLQQAKYSQAEALIAETLEIRRRVLGPEHPSTLTTMTNLATAYEEEGKYQEAEVLQSQALEINRRLLGSEHPNTLRSLTNLANTFDDEGKYAQAEALHSEALRISLRVLGPQHPDTLISMMDLGEVYRDQGKNAQAEALDKQTLEIERRVLGAEHRLTLMCMMNLGNADTALGRYVAAEVLHVEALDTKRRVLGPEHPDTLFSMHSLANTYAAERKYAQAETLMAQALETHRRLLGAENAETLSTTSDAAFMRQLEGKYALAENYAALALAGRRHALGSEHPVTMASAADLALAYISQGKFPEAEPLAREALEFDRKKEPDDWQRFRAESLLGASLAGQKKYAEAEPLLLEGYQGMLARKDRIGVPDRYHLDRAREWLVQLYQAWGKPGKVAEWRRN